jgi:hypothetical protein
MTDELRRLLDERGVEWWPMHNNGYYRERDTEFVVNGKKHTAHEWGDGLAVYGLSPEQAIAATLGRPTFDANLEQALSFMRIWISDDAHLGESAISCELEKAEGLRKLDAIEDAIAATLDDEINGETSDGYHTFNELYHHRAVLFSVIVANHRGIAWKSKRHHDGTMYDGMFIVGIDTPDGQATYHYDVDPYWDMFDCEELDRAPEWDGHTPDDAIGRIGTLATGDEVYTREDVEGAFVSGYSLGSLPVGSDPQWDENRQTVDEHMSDLGWVRKESALGHDRDAIYDAGFSSGVKATLQQLEGKIANHAGIVEIEEWIDEQWEDE